MSFSLDHYAPGMLWLRSAFVTALALLAVLAPRAAAGDSELSPVIALHTGWFPNPKSDPALAPGFDGCSYAPTQPCSEYEVQLPFFDWSAAVWVMVARGDPDAGVSGVSFTIDYDGAWASGVDVYGWFNCGDTDTSTGLYPEPGHAYIIEWDPETNCQRTEIGTDGVHTAAGYFYVAAYSDDAFRIPTPQEGTPVAFSVTDCNGNTIVPDQGAPAVGFGAVEGYNPCAEDVPVIPSTWGRIKTKY